jgi:hypothetical protein
MNKAGYATLMFEYSGINNTVVDYAFDPAVIVTVNFSDSVNNSAYGRSNATDTVSTLSQGQFTSATAPNATEGMNGFVFAANGYSALASNDSIYANLSEKSSAANTNREPFGTFNLSINANVNSLQWLYVAIDQKRTASAVAEKCYYWIFNYTRNGWDSFATETTSATDNLGSLNYTSGFSNIISNKRLLLMSHGSDMDNGEGCFVDYVEVQYKYSNAPIVNSLAISPQAPINTSTLSCNATLADSDNSTFNVEWFWYNNTKLVFSGNTTGVSNNTNTIITTLGDGNTTRFELWNCTIRGFDGSEYSPFSSVSVNISDTAPTQDLPTITPSSPINTSDLTCNWNNVQDVEGDTVQNITNWYKNNQSITVLYMPFEGGSTSGISGTNGSTKDYSSYGNNGTAVTATWNMTGGKIGGGYVFNGTSGLINAGRNSTLNNMSALTVEAWIYPNSAGGGGYGRIVDKSDQTTPVNGWQFYISSGTPARIEFIMDYVTNDIWRQTNSIITLNRWQHVAVTWNGSDTAASVHIYLNGTEPSSYNANTDGTGGRRDDSIANPIIGNFKSGTRGFNGSIDEVKIYNYTLSAEQINENYLAGLANRSSNMIVHNETQIGDTWICSVTPNDGYVNGITSNSSAVTITSAGNAAPSVSSISMSPSLPNTSSTLSCNATVVDSENSTLAIEWTWYNSSTSKFTGTTYGVLNNTNTVITTLGNENTTRYDLWNCTIRAWDGTSYSGYNSTSSNISNAIPSQETPSITPALPTISNNLTCNYISVSDADPDAVQNITNWYKNNRSITVLYLPFEGVNGRESTNATDYSGYGNNATVLGPTWNRTGGKIGAAYYFNGNEILPQASNIYMKTPGFTWEFWMSGRAIPTGTSIARDQILIGDIDGTACEDVYLGFGSEFTEQRNFTFVVDGNGECGNRDSTPINYYPNGGFKNNVWYHVAAVRDFNNTNSVKLYINGTLVASKSFSGSLINRSLPFTIGGQEAGAFNFNGFIDELKVYNMPLTQQQIYQNYLAGLANITANVIVSNETTLNDEWLCSATPNDGYGDGATRNSTAVNIQSIANSQPNISAIALSPSSANTSSNIQCNATAVDAENTSLTIEWYWYNSSALVLSGNATGISNNTNSIVTTLGSGNTSKGETWNCTVRSYDGTSYSQYYSSATTILNLAPEILSQSYSEVLPNESSTRQVWIIFNASDADGLDDLNESTARISLNLTGEIQRNSTSCIAQVNDTANNNRQYNCSAYLNYYDRDGSWTINASITDKSSIKTIDVTNSLSYGQLQAIRANIDGISFTGMNFGESAGASNDPMLLNNTGNQNFSSINITAYDLIGSSYASEIINASRFYVNATANNLGMQLQNSSSLRIANAILPRDTNGIDTNVSLYFWVSMPGSGLRVQNYTSYYAWYIDANT